MLLANNKPNSVEDDHLSRLIITNQLKRATFHQPLSGWFALAPGRACRAIASPQGGRGLTPLLFTLTKINLAVLSLWRFP